MDKGARSRAATSTLKAQHGPGGAVEAAANVQRLPNIDRRQGQHEYSNAPGVPEELPIHLDLDLWDPRYQFQTSETLGSQSRPFQSSTMEPTTHVSHSADPRWPSVLREYPSTYMDHNGWAVFDLSGGPPLNTCITGASWNPESIIGLGGSDETHNLKIAQPSNSWLLPCRASDKICDHRPQQVIKTPLQPNTLLSTEKLRPSEGSNSVTHFPTLGTHDHRNAFPNSRKRRISLSEDGLRPLTDDRKISPMTVSMWNGDNVSLPASKLETLSEIALATTQICERYCQEAVIKPCSTAQSRGASIGKLSCTWGCGFSTDSRESWERHEEKRQPQHIYRCAECLATTAKSQNRGPYMHHRKDKFLEHARRMHRDTDPIKLRTLSHVDYYLAPFTRSCIFSQEVRHEACSHSFSSWKERNDHYIAHFDDQIPDGPWYIAADTIMRRLEQSMKAKDDDSSRLIDPGTGDSTTSKCWCGKTFQNLTDLKHHERYHAAGPLPYRCQMCQKEFVHRKDLLRHEFTHDKNSIAHYACPYVPCRGQFARADHLTRHVVSRHSAKAYASMNSSTISVADELYATHGEESLPSGNQSNMSDGATGNGMTAQ
nr:zinc finger protein 628 [Quercus suber]